MVNLIRRRVLRRLIWFCTVCLCPTKRTLGLYWLTSESEWPPNATTKDQRPETRDQPTAPLWRHTQHYQSQDCKNTFSVRWLTQLERALRSSPGCLCDTEIAFFSIFQHGQSSINQPTVQAKAFWRHAQVWKQSIPYCSFTKQVRTAAIIATSHANAFTIIVIA